MSTFKIDPIAVPSADTITLKHIQEARATIEQQAAKHYRQMEQSMFDNIYANQRMPEPEYSDPTEEEMTRTAEILTEAVLLLHAGNWRDAQHKLLSRNLPGLPDAVFIDVHKKNMGDHMQDAARYGRSSYGSHLTAGLPRQQGKSNMTATAMQSKYEAANQQMSAIHRQLLEQLHLNNLPPILLKEPWNQNAKT